MSLNPPPPGNVPAKAFPPPTAAPKPKSGGLRPLILPRRGVVSPLQRAQAASQASALARKSIDAIFSQSRAPWGGEAHLSVAQIEELQKTVRTLEAKLAERELALAEAESKLGDRERALAEAEALLQARAQVVNAAQKNNEEGTAISKEQGEAFNKLKEELDRQEESIKAQRQVLKDREEFLEQSETALFEKMQSQQEKESELEQKEEDIKRMARQAGLLKAEPKEPMERA
jgi:chromosome segregation ATPase